MRNNYKTYLHCSERLKVVYLCFGEEGTQFGEISFIYLRYNPGCIPVRRVILFRFTSGIFYLI